jgi:hypothetical protein
MPPTEILPLFPLDEGRQGNDRTVDSIRSTLGRCSVQQQQAIGIIFGTMVGDVLGSAVEGWKREAIIREYPMGLTEFQLTKRTAEGVNGPAVIGNYTDDFQVQHTYSYLDSGCALAVIIADGNACLIIHDTNFVVTVLLSAVPNK